MGSLTARLQQLTGQDQDEKEAKARVDLLLMAAKTKISAFRDEINAQFVNPAEIDRIQILGNRAIRFIEQYHIATSTNFSQ